MKSIEEITKFIATAAIKTNTKTSEAVLANLYEELENAACTGSARAKPGIWRIIMNNVRIRKVAIAMIVCVVILAIVPFKGTTALGVIANGVTTTLSRLKALVLGEELPATEHDELQIDNSVKILTKSSVYSSSDISSLEDFLKERNIIFTPTDPGTAKYAVISSDNITVLQEFLQSSDSFKIVASPNLLTYSGQKAMIAIVNTAGAAITVLQDENEQLNLNFAFHNGQDGCDISEIKLAKGEALLISGINFRQNESSDTLMTTLVLPEVIQD